jgi:hypothetical protein
MLDPTEGIMRISILLGLSLGVVLAASPAISQQVSVGAVRTHIDGIEVPPVANAPFTAKVIVVWNQPLVGGGTASRKYYTMVARDSAGRVRRETRGFVRADSDAEPPLRSFTILDPVAGTRTTCTKAWMTCATSAFDPHLQLAKDADAEQANSSSESIGQQLIDGLTTTGTRETTWNASGTRSTSRLALSQTESWYSADLQMNLSVSRNDPQAGEVTLNVTSLVQGEPDSSWFAIPPGYTVKDGRGQ